MSNDLKLKLAEARKLRDEHISSMGNEYSAQVMDRLAVLQKMVASAEQNLELSNAPAPEVEEQEMCVVTLVQGGKNDRCVEIPAMTTVSELVNSLGMDIKGLSFKKRLGPGVTTEITAPEESVLGPGQHEIFVTPKVIGGI